MKKFVKTKEGQALGFRTPEHFKGKIFGVQKQAQRKFDPARFKVQHKG